MVLGQPAILAPPAGAVPVCLPETAQKNRSPMDPHSFFETLRVKMLLWRISHPNVDQSKVSDFQCTVDIVESKDVEKQNYDILQIPIPMQCGRLESGQFVLASVCPSISFSCLPTTWLQCPSRGTALLVVQTTTWLHYYLWYSWIHMELRSFATVEGTV